MKERRQRRRGPRPVVEALEGRNLVSTLIPTDESAGSLRDPAALIPIAWGRRVQAGRPRDQAAAPTTDEAAPLDTEASVSALASSVSGTTAAAKGGGGGKLPYDHPREHEGLFCLTS
jgi:hypothetical protein